MLPPTHLHNCSLHGRLGDECRQVVCKWYHLYYTHRVNIMIMTLLFPVWFRQLDYRGNGQYNILINAAARVPKRLQRTRPTSRHVVIVVTVTAPVPTRRCAAAQSTILLHRPCRQVGIAPRLWRYLPRRNAVAIQQ